MRSLFAPANVQEKPRSSFGNVLRSLLGKVEVEQIERGRTAAESYENLVATLAAVERGEAPAPDAAEVAEVLKAASQTVADLEAAVSRQKRIAQLTSIVENREAAVNRRRDAESNLQAELNRFEQARLSHVQKIDQLQAAISQAANGVNEIDSAENELSRLLSGDREEQIRERKAELVHQLSRIQFLQVAARQPHANGATLSNRLSEIEKEIANAFPGDHRDRLEAEAHRLRNKLTSLNQVQAIEQEIAQLDQELSELRETRLRTAIANV